MSTFWIIAGALALLATLTVALPLLGIRAGAGVKGSRAALNVSVYRDQLAELEEDRHAGRLAEAQYDEARSELERRVLDDVPEAQADAGTPTRGASSVAAVATALAVPLLAGFLYLAIGNPAALSPGAATASNAIGPHEVDAAIAQLSARLANNPGDGPGWVMLARSQAMLGRFVEASSAYAKSVAISPDDAQLLVDYADALAMANGRRLQGEPERLVERALRIDPTNLKALALAGTIAFEKNDFKAAVKHWEGLLGAAPADSEFARTVAASIEEAKAKSRVAGSAVAK